jgi:transcriptional regulator with XRE-family HTH domain
MQNPASAANTRRTSRTLACTLKCLRLRDIRKPSLREAEKLLKIKKSQIGKIETGEEGGGLTYNTLERYELVFTVPTGIILTVSHVASLFRDATDGTSPASKRKARQRLETMAIYLENLTKAIKSRSGVRNSYQWRGVKDDDQETWLAVIDKLMDDAQNGLDKTMPSPFEDPLRLAAMTWSRQIQSTTNPAAVSPKLQFNASKPKVDSGTAEDWAGGDVDGSTNRKVASHPNRGKRASGKITKLSTRTGRRLQKI